MYKLTATFQFCNHIEIDCSSLKNGLTLCSSFCCYCHYCAYKQLLRPGNKVFLERKKHLVLKNIVNLKMNTVIFDPDKCKINNEKNCVFFVVLIYS